jgi:acyl carrier protein
MANRESTSALLASKWCLLLDVEKAESADDFFELGGNSMTAVRLSAAIEMELGIEFPLETLFLDGTFGALVAACVSATDPADPRNLDGPPSSDEL